MGKIKRNSVFTMVLAILVSGFLLLAICPQPVFADQVGIEIKSTPCEDETSTTIEYLTEQLINDKGFEIVITLPGEVTWANHLIGNGDVENESDGNELLKSLLLDSITATPHSEEWDQVLEGMTIKKIEHASEQNGTQEALTITVKALVGGNGEDGNGYNIDANQKVTINLKPALLENWTQSIAPYTFDIYANPRAFIEGSITTATPEDIRKGGKTIQIRLLNATWNEGAIETAEGLHSLLDLFDGEDGEDEGELKKQWTEVIDAIKYDLPVRLKNNDTVLEIVLPPVPDYTINDKQEITFKASDGGKAQDDGQVILIRDKLFDEPESGELGSFLLENDPSFKITPARTPAELTAELKESEIVGDATITITLTENTWADDLASTSDLNLEKQKTFINAFAAHSEPEQWEKIKDAIKSSEGSFEIDNDSNDKTLKITIPTVEGYLLTQDQIITLNIPPQMLAEGVQLAPLTLTIKATPKAILTTTTTFNESEIAAGGKTITVTLVNAAWNPQIATNNELRNGFIDLLEVNNSGEEDADAAAWNDALPVIKANGQISVNGPLLTLSLPPIHGFDIVDEIKIGITTEENGSPIHKLACEFLSEINNETSDETNGGYISSHGQVTIIPSTNQSATISGSILNKTTDWDLASGGKEMTIKLQNDTWKSDFKGSENDGTENDIKKLLKGLKFSESEDNGDKQIWNGYIDSQKEEVEVAKVNNQELTIVFKEDSSEPFFKLDNDFTVQFSIKEDLLSTANDPVIATPAFTIFAVQAEVSGTAVDQLLDPADLIKGGKTILVTLKNATWADVDNGELVASIFESNNNGPWVSVLEALTENPKNIKRSNNTLTIKLPPVPNYDPPTDASRSISIEIPYKYIKEAPITNSDQEICLKATGKINISQAASGNITSGTLEERDIVTGETTITIELTGAQWVANLSDNTKAKNALIKGFSVQDQPNQWKIISSALPQAGWEIDENNVLTITIPPLPQFSLVRDQKVALIIPKAALASAKNDLPAGTFTIKVPTISGEEPLEQVLVDSGKLMDYTEKPREARVLVPPKIVETIKLNNIVLTGEDGNPTTLTTIEVFVKPDLEEAKEVQLAVTSNVKDDGQSEPEKTEEVQDIEKGFPAIFVFSNLLPNSDLEVSVMDGGGNNLQAPIKRKITTGNKVYNETTKKDYSGSYSFYEILTDKNLFKDILKYYPLSDLKIGKIGN